jgi:ribosomal protein S18 acetylase RimI-like enzyme
MNNLLYKNTLPPQGAFYELFITTTWNKKYQLSPDELTQALKNSWYLISAYNDEKLVGFGRILCDGVVHALILDLIVHPEFQNLGIGDQILKQLVEECRKHQIRDIQLFCARGYKSFYIKRGFAKRPDDAPGMEYMTID